MEGSETRIKGPRVQRGPALVQELDDSRLVVKRRGHERGDTRLVLKLDSSAGVQQRLKPRREGLAYPKCLETNNPGPFLTCGLTKMWFFGVVE